MESRRCDVSLRVPPVCRTTVPARRRTVKKLREIWAFFVYGWVRIHSCHAWSRGGATFRFESRRCAVPPDQRGVAPLKSSEKSGLFCFMVNICSHAWTVRCFDGWPQRWSDAAIRVFPVYRTHLTGDASHTGGKLREICFFVL